MTYPSAIAKPVALRRALPLLLLGALAVGGITACSSGGEREIVLIGASPTPTATPTPSLTPTPTATPTPTPTPVPVARIYGIEAGTQLIRFAPASPGTAVAIGTVPSLGAGETVIGLDVRPSDNDMIAVTSTGRLLRLDDLNPGQLKATELQSLEAGGIVLETGEGLRYGVDFNPAVAAPGDVQGAVNGALRIIASTGQNIRILPAALLDTPPSPPAPAPTPADGRMGYQLTGLSGLALDLADASPVLRVIDQRTTGGRLLQSSGPFAQDTAAAAALSATGRLLNNGRELRQVGGFDSRGATHFALLGVTGADGTNSSGIYAIDVLTGAATEVRRLSTTRDYQGLVVRSATDVMVLRVDGASGQSILRFNPAACVDPCDNLVSRSQIQGLSSAELVAIADQQLSSGGVRLWALDADGRLFELDEPAPGFPVAAVQRGRVTLPLQGEDVDLSFNRNRGRFLATVGDGRVFEIDDPFLGGTTLRRSLRVTAPETDAPQVVATAYRAAPGNGFQFVIDARTSCVLRVLTPNDGLLQPEPPADSCNLLPGGTALDGPQSFDIAGANDSLVLAALNLRDVPRTRLFRVNLQDGQGTPLELIGDSGTGRIQALTVRFE